MNKKEICWLLVRATGVALLLNGLRYALLVIENILAVPTGSAGQMLMSNSAGLFASWCLEAVLFVGVGVYLIKRGGFLFNWLNSESNQV
ncbi:hypothetical protein [Pseudoduganella violaceinigra]|uniref:hypothetical protein n=1 Tax=Pseudoduganella violaceinigra TaxID=246602 RepID=UPI00047F1763|nr:hypothetical protein [Pseudoduganella violaceinigra]